MEREAVEPISIQSAGYGTVVSHKGHHQHPVASQLPMTEVRTYWWRWAVLGIFVLNQLVSNLLWITFAPVADVMRCYYHITNDLVNTLSLASSVLALLLVLPASWLLVRFGIRFVVVLSSFATAIGGALRVMGAGAGYFSLLMVGQIVSSFNGLMMGSTTLLSEIWFPASERATATAIGAAIAPQVRIRGSEEKIGGSVLFFSCSWVCYWGMPWGPASFTATTRAQCATPPSALLSGWLLSGTL